MAKRPLLGLFNDANSAADAGDALKGAGISENDYDFLTDAPYPEGALANGRRSIAFTYSRLLVQY